MDDYRGLELDAAAIKVLAHPLRSRLLSQLRIAGPATATDLAQTLATNTGATSYHLRQLESVGLVTDTGEGAGRRRLWRASTDFHAWNRSDFGDDEDTTTALGWLERHYVHQFTRRAEAWQDVLAEWPKEWVDALGLMDTMVTVDPEQMRALQDEIGALLARYRHAGDDRPDARKISVYSYAAPTDLSPPQQGAAR